MAAFHFELVSPEKLLFSGDVESVVAPGAEGQFTVLKDHAPVMTTLKAGVVTVAGGDGKVEKLFVRGGFADVNAAGFTILAELALPLSDIEAGKLDADIKNAKEDFSDAKTDAARLAASEKLAQLEEMRAALTA
ncbi:F0F1 ATP synthase subunit epsilon [Methylocystis sp. MJC1]|jgi:F-type H+-transporting ATPase subunit epsilon|uniref:F0F1 ATP synthase subunit epsilon n=1 Tax=Methylocystis sp. MJC1 TaxID=2654282 RepID=UPI0013EADCA6|nr:F0F1 ATP synthase subunit epsilon [Methylocystis sp. MJC1]KAF2990776.1 ATP synthase epsilon chain [Methylocystis sp. MJC1]MBU6528627.1 F0F1 ATP synthase subunit epsilon [Methylocystis sp. MJC1]UZX11519.1 F0F1 ATP synthase subunit epsilon [Methylocystis sp. MJC1]